MRLTRKKRLTPRIASPTSTRWVINPPGRNGGNTLDSLPLGVFPWGSAYIFARCLMACRRKSPSGGPQSPAVVLPAGNPRDGVQLESRSSRFFSEARAWRRTIRRWRGCRALPREHGLFEAAHAAVHVFPRIRIHREQPAVDHAPNPRPSTF